MEKNKIIELLKSHIEYDRGSEKYSNENIEKFASYCIRTKLAKRRNSNEFQNLFMQKRTSKDMATLFNRVAQEWLIFDWVNITIQSTWVSYNYVAYKNKMLIAYPETVIDVNLVYKDDKISFSKENWKILYNHEFNNPFEKKDSDVIWAYAIIKNRRWEFLSTLTKEELEKHRKVAKTDFIWRAWFQEMCMKTIVKKACSFHFRDVFEKIEEMDNENYDLEKVNKSDEPDLSWFKKIEKEDIDKKEIKNIK